MLNLQANHCWGLMIRVAGFCQQSHWNFTEIQAKILSRQKGKVSIWAIFLVCSVPFFYSLLQIQIIPTCLYVSFVPLDHFTQRNGIHEFLFNPPLTTGQLEEPLHVQQGERYQKKLTVAIREPMAFDKTRLGMINLANEVCLWKLLTLKPLKAFTSAWGSW